MYLQDRQAACTIRSIQRHLPVKASGAQQGWIEYVRAVGGRDDDHVRVVVEAVHLDQDLVERLLPFVVTTAQARAAMPSYRVDLVHENERRRFGLGLLKQVTDAARADADEH